MKKIFTLITSIIFSQNVFSQPVIQWQKCLGGSGNSDYAYSIWQTADSGYIVAGFANSIDGDVTGNHGGNFDYWIVKLTGTGNMQWQKCLGGSGGDVAYSIRQITGGGYIVTGSTSSIDDDVVGNHGSEDYWIVQLTGAGNIQWQKCLGGSGDERAYSIQQTADSGYIVAGHTDSNDSDLSGNQGGYDMWIVKLTGTGNIQWQKCLGGSGEDLAYFIEQTADSGYVVAGTTLSNDGDVTGNHGGYDTWIVKLTGTGSIQWQKCLGGSSDERAYSIEQTADSGYIVAGYTDSNDSNVSGNHGGYDMWIVKLTSTGSIQWQKCLGGTNSDVAYAIQQTGDGGYIATGYSQSNDGDVTGHHGGIGIYDMWLVKLTGTGNIEWQICLGGSSSDWANSLQQTADGGYAVAGLTDSNDGDVTGNHGGADYWIVKLSPYVGIEELSADETLSLAPNPATNQLTVKNSEFKVASVEVYDVMGKLLTLPFDFAQGDARLNVSSLAPGIYFVKVRGEKQERVGKFVKQ